MHFSCCQLWGLPTWHTTSSRNFYLLYRSTWHKTKIWCLYLLNRSTTGEVAGVDEDIARWNLHLDRNKNIRIILASEKKGRFEAVDFVWKCSLIVGLLNHWYHGMCVLYWSINKWTFRWEVKLCVSNIIIIIIIGVISSSSIDEPWDEMWGCVCPPYRQTSACSLRGDSTEAAPVQFFRLIFNWQQTLL